MTKQTIAVDLDDVLAAERDSIRQFINHQYGQKFTTGDYDVQGEYWTYWRTVWQKDVDTAKKWYEHYLKSGAHANHPIIPGAIETIKELKKSYEFVVVTSRQDFMLDISKQWLNKNFPGVFKRIEFVRLWSKDKKATKAEICYELGASYLIDDNVEHCNLAAEAGIKSLLFGSYGWNRHAKNLHKNVVRVKNWQDVAEYFGV